MGDFNYRGIDWSLNTTTGGSDSNEQSFLDTVNDQFMHQHVNEPTRCRPGQRPSLLDLILTSSDDTVGDVAIGPPIGKSDHMTITFNMDIKNMEPADELLSRSYYHADFDKMRKQLKDIDWSTKFENITGIQAWD